MSSPWRWCEIGPPPTPPTDAAVAALGRTQVVELTVLIGYYDAVALLLAVFRVGLPGDAEPGQPGVAAT